MEFSYPTFANILGKEIKLNTDFREWIKILACGDDMQVNEAQVMLLQFRLAFSDFETIKDDLIATPQEYYKAIGDFIACGKKDKKEDSNKTKTLDFEQDWPYLVGAFKHDYNIDLDDEKTELHWWKFCSLLNSLSESNMICKIIGYRAQNLSEVKDKKMREFYAKMKREFELKDKWEDYREDMDEEIDWEIELAELKAKHKVQNG